MSVQSLKPLKSKSLRWLTVPFIAMSVLTLTACKPSATLLLKPPPANLATPCPPVAELRDGTGGTVLKWGVSTVKLYRECQLKHQGLVEAWPK